MDTLFLEPGSPLRIISGKQKYSIECDLSGNRFRCPLPAGMPTINGRSGNRQPGPAATCCPTGKFNVAPATECLVCPNATNSAGGDGSDCFVCDCGSEPCAKGEFGRWMPGSGHMCTTCPRGTFQDVLGAEGTNSCKSCRDATDKRFHDSDPGSSDIADCVAVLLNRFCGAGQSAVNTAFGFCENCTAGRFKGGNNTRPCESCPCGQWQSLPGQGTCGSMCAAGTFGSAETGRCEPCPPVGFFCVKAQKIPFALAARCIPGERELFAPNTTADRVCVPCAPGTFSNVSNALSCSACGADEFQPSGGQAFCTRHVVCAAGERQSTAPTAVSDRGCALCVPGTFSNTSNAPACFACGTGQFQPVGGSSFCTRHTVCVAGERSTVPPTATTDRDCQPCAAGSFSAQKNAPACQPCPLGTFQRDAAQATCMKHSICIPGQRELGPPSMTADRDCELCARGTFSNRTNAPACSACSPGTFQAAVGQARCFACAAGRVGDSSRSVMSALHCAACAVGQYQVREGQISCAPCPAGFFSAGGAPSCTACIDGTFQDATGASSCVACEECAGGTHRKGCSGASRGYCGVCSPGTYVDGGTCQKCSPGRFSGDENLDRCRACQRGTYQSEDGKSFCDKHTQCVPGQRETVAPSVTADRACEDCPEGRFSTSGNSISCIPCAPCDSGLRKSCGSSSGGFCATCSPGRWFNRSLATCQDCRAGFWCQGAKAFGCGGASLYCPANSSTPSTVAVGHYSVPTSAPETQRVGQRPCEAGFTCTRGIRTPCPPGRVCLLSTTARVVTGVGTGQTVKVTAQERCDDDKFVFNGTCTPCPPEGAECRNGLVTLANNFWYDADKYGTLAEFWGKRHNKLISQETRIYRCAADSCAVSNMTGKPVCNEGRSGTLCAVCDGNFYNTNNLECKRCPKSENVAKYVVGLFSSLLLVGAILIY